MATPLAIQMLNTLLASEYVLLVRTRAAHWNVEDEAFGPFHSLFGDQYDQLSSLADAIAERARQLGGTALGSMREFIDNAFVSETPSNIGTAKEFGSNLIKMHETLISKGRKMIDYFESTEQDKVTANMLQDWVASHEKMLWFLKSHKLAR